MPKLTIAADRCKGCDLCVDACPKNLLVLSSTAMNSRGFRPVELTDEEACNSCAICAMMCPDLVFTSVEKEDS